MERLYRDHEECAGTGCRACAGWGVWLTELGYQVARIARLVVQDHEQEHGSPWGLEAAERADRRMQGQLRDMEQQVDRRSRR